MDIAEVGDGPRAADGTVAADIAQVDGTGVEKRAVGGEVGAVANKQCRGISRTGGTTIYRRQIGATAEYIEDSAVGEVQFIDRVRRRVVQRNDSGDAVDGDLTTGTRQRARAPITRRGPISSARGPGCGARDSGRDLLGAAREIGPVARDFPAHDYVERAVGEASGVGGIYGADTEARRHACESTVRHKADLR